MKRKIDSALGRAIYGRRLGTVEPVFANITRMLGLNRFTLRGKRKVNTQWLLYCLVHNIGKLLRYAPGFCSRRLAHEDAGQYRAVTTQERILSYNRWLHDHEHSEALSESGLSTDSLSVSGPSMRTP